MWHLLTPSYWICSLCGKATYIGELHDNCPVVSGVILKETKKNFYKTALRTYLNMDKIHKCGVCGSTAIDHTDKQCRINQEKKGE